VSCIGTVIQNYFKIYNASYTPSVIPHECIHNLRVVASETLYVLLENRAWEIVSRPPGNILRLANLVDARATSVLMTPTHIIILCEKLCNAATEVFTSITVMWNSTSTRWQKGDILWIYLRPNALIRESTIDLKWSQCTGQQWPPHQHKYQYKPYLLIPQADERIEVRAISCP
jgi:hypothetical protein